jgi:tetraacyldisaccharide 4'-kinase
MRAPDFWWSNTAAARLAAVALAPLGILYGASVARKSRTQKSYGSSVPVICVGNLTVGGTGKTPVAIAIAKLLQDHGVSPMFLLRGYGSGAREALVVSEELHNAARVGDEALLLARVAPAIVSPDRAKGAQIAEAQGAQVIVMDDGHQNFSLHKDVSVVVVDGETGFGNGGIVPAGPLREPVQRGLRRADAVMVMGDGNPPLPGFAGPVLRARLVAAQRLDGRRVIAFAGIGRPEKFFDTLGEIGAEIVESHAYADHCVYSAAEIARLKDRAARAGAALITTEKDFVRLDLQKREGIEVLPIRAVFEDTSALRRLLQPLLPQPTAAR